MPPRWMWPLEWELEMWFNEIERRRGDREAGVEDSKMSHNKLADSWRRKLKS